MDLLIGNSTSTCHGSQGIGIDLILKLAITMLMVRKTLGTSGMKHRIVFKALTFYFLLLVLSRQDILQILLLTFIYYFNLSCCI